MDYNIFKVPETYKDLYVVGDIHGEIRELVFNITVKHEIKDSVIVVAGDVGLGFEKPAHYENLWNRVKPRLVNNNNLILFIRGNHDDPDYYNGEKALNFDNMKSLPDYTKIIMNDKVILCIGGAISVDRDWRSEQEKTCWWENEDILRLTDKEINKLEGRIYCVISHESPISFLPVFNRDQIINTDSLFFDVMNSRDYLEKILWRCQPKRWYYGHYHKSMSSNNGRTQYRCLCIQELIRVPIEESDDTVLPEDSQNP